MSINKPVQISLILSAISLCSPNLVRAIDIGGTNVVIQPSLTTGLMYYSFEQDAISVTGTNFNSTQEKIKLSDTMPTLGVGFGIGIGDFIFSLSAQKAFDGSDEDTISSSTFGEGFAPYDRNYGVGETKLHSDFDRNDYSASIGYSLTEQMSVYVGYKWAKTEFSNVSDSVVQLTLFPDISGGNFKDRDQFDAEIESRENFEFENQGPLIGINYGLNFEEGAFRGRLYFSVATAFLQGNTKINIKSRNIKITRFDGQSVSGEQLPENIATGQVFKTEGDTIGFTFGVRWTGETSIDNLKYTLGVQGYQYQFDADDSSGIDTSETVMQFNAGVSYVF